VVYSYILLLCSRSMGILNRWSDILPYCMGAWHLVVVPMIEYTTEFDLVWANYPKRGGGNPKAKAFKAYKARIKDGYSRADLLSGVQKYNKFCTQTNKLRTEFIMMASTFFNKDESFLEEWELPREEAKNESWQDKEKRLGTSARVGESMDSYMQRLNQSR